MASLWSIQVLTPDFLFDGRIDGDGGDKFYALTAAESSSQPSSCRVHLTGASVQATGNLATPAGAIADWDFFGASAFVLIIPRDEASTTFLVKQNKFKSLIPADIYLGSYRISGKVWSSRKPEEGLDFLRNANRFLMQDARIDNLLPGAKMQTLEAPFAVARTHLLQCAVVHP